MAPVDLQTNQADLKTKQMGLQRRIVILLSVTPLITILIAIGAGYLLLPLQWQTWLPFGGGLLLLGVAFVWGTLWFLERHFNLVAEQSQLVDQLSDNSSSSLASMGSVSEIPGARRESYYSDSRSDQPSSQLMELLPEAVISTRRGDVDYINTAGVDLLGAKGSEQLIGKSLIAFVHPQDQAKAREQIHQLCENRLTTPPVEQKYVRLDGSEIDVEVKGLLLGQTDEPEEYFVIRNITERKQMERRFARRTRQLTVLQSAGLAITSRLDLRYVLDTIALEMTKLLEVESCTIFEWNQTDDTIVKVAQYNVEQGWWDPASKSDVYKLADYPLTRLVLKDQIPEQMTISQRDIDPFEQAYMQSANLKTVLVLPVVSLRRVLGLIRLEDGRFELTFPYEEISLAKLLANQAASAIENAQLFEQAQQEIVERKQAEAALEEERALLAQRVRERTIELSKANAELTRASKLKDEFLASMSHELRTPLNAIIGSSEILHTELFGPLNERQQNFAHNIEESGRHLLSLINDILDLSKVEAGKLGLEIRTVSVQAVCEASLRLVKQLAHKKQLQLSTKFNHTISTIQADERRLKQILVNLLSNAIKFTPEGGKVGLEVAEDEEQQIINYSVWDTGIGIAQEDLERLFQPFVQLDSDLSREFLGTGLGLSLVHRLVKLHNGGIEVESRVGEGSRFTVSLPCAGPQGSLESISAEETLGNTSPPSRDTLPEITPKQREEQPLVLLADDNEDNINMLLDFLEAQGYRVTVARNGPEALERAQEEVPDIILMDVQMPGIDGLEVVRRLRVREELAETPIVAVTALAMSGDRKRCLAAGANEYISKPLSPTNLIKIIESLLR